jgi:hypothetical protein
MTFRRAAQELPLMLDIRPEAWIYLNSAEVKTQIEGLLWTSTKRKLHHKLEVHQRQSHQFPIAFNTHSLGITLSASSSRTNRARS